jgi:NAD(P)-dependent dehydrogenase (short-subunit alcohol dehydrogenase family)
MAKADHSRWPKPHQIAETMVFLADPDNATTRGAVIPVYGSS